MNKRTDRINDGKGSITRSAADRQHDEQQEVQLEDKRPVAIAQRKIQSTIDYSSSHTSEKQAAYSYHPVQLSEDGSGGSDGKKGETKQSEGGKETKQEAQSSDGTGEKKGLSLKEISDKVNEVMKTRLVGMVASPQHATHYTESNYETIDLQMKTTDAKAILSEAVGVSIEIKELRIHFHSPGRDADHTDYPDTKGFHYGQTWVTWQVGDEKRTCKLDQSEVNVQIGEKLIALYNFGKEEENVAASSLEIENLLAWVNETPPTKIEFYGKEAFQWVQDFHKVLAVKLVNGGFGVTYMLNGSKVFLRNGGKDILDKAVNAKLTPPPPSTTQSPTPPKAVGQ